MLREIQAAMRAEASPEIAAHSRRFFKTGAGEYGEGDRFLGIRVPVLRRYVRQYRAETLGTVLRLLRSRFHEERLLALLMLVERFQRAEEPERKVIYEQYLANTGYVNNWDLVDSSAHPIVGGFLLERSRKILYTLVGSSNLWERRIAMVATYHFIQHNDMTDTLALAERLMSDTEDLIHKASGWMLREVGKRDQNRLIDFLDRHAAEMPRTMLRYAIERFTPELRQHYRDLKS